MIPTIGLMIGFYIVTRMLSLATRKGDRAEASVVRISAALTLIVAVLGMVSLFMSGISLSDFTGR